MELFGLLALFVVAVTANGARMKPEALCYIESTTGSDENVEGMISFYKQGSEVHIKVNLTGLDSTNEHTMHGLHIHASGSIEDACRDAGGHFNPHNRTHGDVDSENRHVGDLGNIEEDSEGRVYTTIIDPSGLIQFEGEHSVIGKGMVLHEKRDDLGMGGDEGSMLTGNAGGRLGCCAIYRYRQVLEDEPITDPTDEPITDPTDSATSAVAHGFLLITVSLLSLVHRALL